MTDSLYEERNDLKRQRITRNEILPFKYMKFEYLREQDSIVIKKHHLDHDEELSNKEVLTHILNSRPAHFAIIGLVVLEIAFVVSDILLDLEIIKVPEDSNLRAILHGLSLSILFLFMIEISLKLYVNWRQFIHHKVEIVDAIVVMVSFVTDFIIIFHHNTDLLSAVEIIIVFRLWRVVRVINGIIVAIQDQADRQIKAVEEKNEELRKELEENKKLLSKQYREIRRLTSLLRSRKIYVDEDFEKKPHPLQTSSPS